MRGRQCIRFLVLYAGAAYLRIQVENSALAWAPAERVGDRVQRTT